MKIQIATAPCSWGVFFPDGRTSGTPYETFLSQAHEAGYKEIELGPDGYLPQDVDVLRDKLQQNELSVCGGTATIPFALMTEEECCGVVDALAQRLVALAAQTWWSWTEVATTSLLAPRRSGVKSSGTRFMETLRLSMTT